MAKRNDYTLRQSGEQVQADLDKIESLDVSDITKRIAANTASIETLNDRATSIESKVAANTKSIEALNSGKQDKTLVVDAMLDFSALADPDLTPTCSVTAQCRVDTPYADCRAAIDAGRTVRFDIYTGMDEDYDYKTAKASDSGVFKYISVIANDVAMSDDWIEGYVTQTNVDSDGIGAVEGGRMRLYTDGTSNLTLTQISSTTGVTEGSNDVVTSGGVYTAIEDAVHFEGQGETDELK